MKYRIRSDINIEDLNIHMLLNKNILRYKLSLFILLSSLSILINLSILTKVNFATECVCLLFMFCILKYTAHLFLRCLNISGL